MAIKLIVQTVTKLLPPNYFIKGSVRYFFWSRRAVKKKKIFLRHKRVLNREILGTAGLRYSVKIFKLLL